MQTIQCQYYLVVLVIDVVVDICLFIIVVGFYGFFLGVLALLDGLHSGLCLHVDCLIVICLISCLWIGLPTVVLRYLGAHSLLLLAVAQNIE